MYYAGLAVSIAPARLPSFTCRPDGAKESPCSSQASEISDGAEGAAGFFDLGRKYLLNRCLIIRYLTVSMEACLCIEDTVW